MTRGVATEIITALAQDSVGLFMAVEMLFDDQSGTRFDEAGYVGDRAVRLWTGYADKTIDGETYTGAGSLLSFSQMEEASDLSAKGMTVALSGEVASLVSLALQEPYQNRKARVLMGVEGESDFVEVFSGILDTMPIQTGATTATISVNIESKYVSLQRPNIRRYTKENHRARFSSDTFFDYTQSLADKEIAWGRKING